MYVSPYGPSAAALSPRSPDRVPDRRDRALERRLREVGVAHHEARTVGR
jgi:hypothetical protein